MAKSRRDKTRKQNLVKYKQKSKKKNMSNLPQSNFRQVPTWSSTDKFEIEGSELEALYNYFNIVAPAFTAIQQVFARGIKGGQIKIGYEHEDGTPVADDDVKAYTEQLNAYFKDKMAKEGIDPNNVGVEESNGEPEESTGKIVDMNGVPAK